MISYDILHSYEKIPALIFKDSAAASLEVAEDICKAINSSEGGQLRLGLCPGTSPVLLYKNLFKMYCDGKVSFKNVEVFSIDEYAMFDGAPLRNNYVKEEFLDKVDILPGNVHILDPHCPADKLYEHCAKFDEMARNLDILVMGVGEAGQIGFNEAGTNEKSRTRTVLLSYASQKRQLRNFSRDIRQVPTSANTMGISTILSAKRIVLLAWGEDKAVAVKKLSEDQSDISCPASLLQKHENIAVYTDENSAELLTRVAAPWTIGPCEWTARLQRQAVVWLCEKTGKPILKLTRQDYLENALGGLLAAKGPYDRINIDVFNDLQHTITGWPGGKPNADDSTRPVKSTPFPKRVVIFSPHPDDDVISMGGTFIRLVKQGHDVHVAYQTSGNIAVHDDVVYQLMDAANQLGFGDKREEVAELVAQKTPGMPEPKELLKMKGALRRSEARAAVRSFGLNDETNAHFLNLPFYESGGIKKNDCTQTDIDIIKKLLQEIKPHQIYMAGDLADPHGTHRVCTEAVMEAIRQLKDEDWMTDCNAWMYRGAWMEWPLGLVDMAVPLSPDEVIMKRHAIFHHLSQKDIVPFPGDDSREFWQRAEDRTQNTARMYDKVGMAEYQAIEVFVKLF